MMVFFFDINIYEKNINRKDNKLTTRKETEDKLDEILDSLESCIKEQINVTTKWFPTKKPIYVLESLSLLVCKDILQQRVREMENQYLEKIQELMNRHVVEIKEKAKEAK